MAKTFFKGRSWLMAQILILRPTHGQREASVNFIRRPKYGAAGMALPACCCQHHLFFLFLPCIFAAPIPMPELPEVEVTRRGVAPHLEGHVVQAVVLRRSGLRWPFPPDLAHTLAGQTIGRTGRRGKYLLIGFEPGTLIIHLGMSGHLRVLPPATPPNKHDHFDLVVDDKVGDGQIDAPSRRQVLRMTDPRRFGAVLWHDANDGPVGDHRLLRGLGAEPLEAGFSGALLHRETRRRSAAIKQVLLAGDIVVGVGNIYCSESLFRAGINPKTPANQIALARYDKLAQAIRDILAAAIVEGGSTLRDFVGVNGQSGYFQQSYFVYDRAGVPCRICASPVRQFKQGQRSTFYCVNCQH
ncbi:MAG: formamidopyrimidine-DNA glycosylase [Janthinobacterium sp.]|jgi:formamidopyrimidine-DNA glycosylase